jgi:hypothetical protein
MNQHDISLIYNILMSDLIYKECIRCNCAIYNWSSLEFTFNELTINKHFYEHIMSYFIAKDCTHIVKEYVGPSPEYKLFTGNYFTTFGLVFIDESLKVRHSDYYSFECSVMRCHLPHYEKGYCQYHYDIWKRNKL